MHSLRWSNKAVLVGGYILISVLCVVLLIAVLSRSCNQCSASMSWYILVLGAAAWAIVAIMSTRMVVVACWSSVCIVSAHVSLALSDMSGLCVFCLGILLLEVLATVYGVYVVLLTKLIERPRNWAILTCVASCGGMLGAFGIPHFVYRNCVPSVADSRSPTINGAGQSVIVFVDPDCKACDYLEKVVLPRFTGKVQFARASKCSPLGRRLIAKYNVRSFPSLIIDDRGVVMKAVSGVDEVQLALMSDK